MLWAYGSYFGGRFITLATTALLARLLVPKDFGLIGFSLLVISFVDAAKGFGINDALIYTSEKIEESAETAFVINIFLGIAQFLIAFLAAPLTLESAGDPRVVPIIRAMALSFIIVSLGSTHDAMLQKELKFKKRFLPEFLATFIKAIVSIGFALSGAGVWSLVYGYLTGFAVQTIAKWWILGWIPRFQFYRDRARALWDFGVHIIMFNLLGIALDQADQLFIGTLLGAVQLGYYSIAVRIPELVISNFSLILTSILFPTYAKMKDDLAALSQSFLLTTKFTALFTFAAGFGMTAVARELVLVVYGDQWEDAIILLQVLSMLGMVVTIPWAAGDVLKAIGRPDISTKLLFSESLYTFPLIWIMVSQSELAVMASFANLIAMSIAAVVRLWVTSQFLNLNPTIFLKILRSPTISAIVMFLVVTLWRSVAVSLPLGVILVTSIIIGGIVYCALLWVLEKEELSQAYHTLRSAIRSRHDAAEL